jgi:hypothetical protein
MTQRPIIWTDMDLRKRFRGDHAFALLQAREARQAGRIGLVIHYLNYATAHRRALANTLRTYRLNDVRQFDPIRFVSGGGFDLVEVK